MAKTLIAKDVHAVLVFQGVLTLLFGVAVIFWPGLSVATLIYLFGAYILVSGIVHLFHGLSSTMGDSWWVLVSLLGLVELGFGIYILRHVHETFTVFISLIGFVLIIRGVIQLVSALFDTRADDIKKGITVVSGLFAAVVGIVILNQKAAAGIAFVWLLGLYAIVIGLMELMATRALQE